MITRGSVERHIGYINEVRPVATSRDVSRHAATTVAPEMRDETGVEAAATANDKPRQATTREELSPPVAPQTGPVSRPVAAESRVVELLESENEFLRGQIAVKDKQIEALDERVFETNSLTAGLQKLLRRS